MDYCYIPAMNLAVVIATLYQAAPNVHMKEVIFRKMRYFTVLSGNQKLIAKT